MYVSISQSIYALMAKAIDITGRLTLPSEPISIKTGRLGISRQLQAQVNSRVQTPDFNLKLKFDYLEFLELY